LALLQNVKDYKGLRRILVGPSTFTGTCGDLEVEHERALCSKENCFMVVNIENNIIHNT
jgi:hypothetical protein